MLCPPLSPDPVVQDWIARHKNPANFALHIVAIPPTILGVLYIPIYLTLLSIPVFLTALGLFAGGYLVQFLGHAIDRSEPGEIALLRRWLRRQWERRAAVGARAGRESS
ncbi:Mpo1-like protein [Tautonia sociabilis]|uniref:DUF962 domain-containing protein n=1 Tax=Tautonia sociabilis TaxID=2080755 RepID=A0A432MHX8_9BACT|nr:Mpo1-like protein [Tautonia sociabilis]RUL86744.1 DUF962 domain-containing protein [Tautonia sociabilis]